MKSYHIDPSGNGNEINARSMPVPDPGHRQVVVRLHAASLNYRDLMILDGRYPIPAVAGVVPLSDGAGEVVGVGPGTATLCVGDRVMGLYFPRWMGGSLALDLARYQPGCTLDGMATEYCVADEDAFIKIPAHLNFDEAATLPCAGLTAWTAVNGGRPILPGTTVAVIGGGSVAMFAIQFASTLGARVVAVTRDVSKSPLLRTQGADEVLAGVPDSDLSKELLRLTSGQGPECIINAVGPTLLEPCIHSCAFGGEIVLVGATTGNVPFSPTLFSGKLLTIRRVAVGSRSDFTAMNRAVAHRQIRPVIDRKFAFDRLPDAYQHFVEQRHRGKVVVAIEH